MSDKINDGGPAFPLQSIGPDFPPGYAGMTLRDYFAEGALSLGGEFFHGFGNGCDDAQDIADACYLIADAMLKARMK